MGGRGQLMLLLVLVMKRAQRMDVRGSHLPHGGQWTSLTLCQTDKLRSCIAVMSYLNHSVKLLH